VLILRPLIHHLPLSHLTDYCIKRTSMTSLSRKQEIKPQDHEYAVRGNIWSSNLRSTNACTKEQNGTFFIRHFLQGNCKHPWCLTIALCIKWLPCNETVMVIARFCATATVWSPTKQTTDEHDNTNVCQIRKITIILKFQDFSVDKYYQS
jgi:hypothetical protein